VPPLTEGYIESLENGTLLWKGETYTANTEKLQTDLFLDKLFKSGVRCNPHSMVVTCQNLPNLQERLDVST
jgi:hypothetical protein